MNYPLWFVPKSNRRFTLPHALKERPNCIILNCVTVPFNYFIFYQLKDQTELGLKTFANILCQFGHFGRFFDPHLAIYNQCDQIGQFFALWATF